MTRLLRIAAVLALILSQAICGFAEAQSRRLKGRLAGMGAGMAIAGPIGGMVGGTVGMGAGMASEKRAKKKRRRREQRADEEQLQAYQEEQRELEQIEAELEQQRMQLLQSQDPATSEIVKDVEAELSALGYRTGEADGVYTEQTQDAIAAYQYVNRLPLDGLPSSELLNDLRSTRIETENDQMRESVAELERQLADLGYRPGTADGVFTVETRRAVESYQFENGLLADGRPTAGLLEHVEETVSDVPEPFLVLYQPGRHQLTDRELVAEIQIHLKALGLDPGGVDGIVGQKTELAIMIYQSYHGVLLDGQPTLALLQHLQESRAIQQDLDTD